MDQPAPLALLLDSMSTKKFPYTLAWASPAMSAVAYSCKQPAHDQIDRKKELRFHQLVPPSHFSVLDHCHSPERLLLLLDLGKFSAATITLSFFLMSSYSQSEPATYANFLQSWGIIGVRATCRPALIELNGAIRAKLAARTAAVCSRARA